MVAHFRGAPVHPIVFIHGLPKYYYMAPTSAGSRGRISSSALSSHGLVLVFCKPAYKNRCSLHGSRIPSKNPKDWLCAYQRMGAWRRISLWFSTDRKKGKGEKKRKEKPPAGGARKRTSTT